MHREAGAKRLNDYGAVLAAAVSRIYICLFGVSWSCKSPCVKAAAAINRAKRFAIIRSVVSPSQQFTFVLPFQQQANQSTKMQITMFSRRCFICTQSRLCRQANRHPQECKQQATHETTFRTRIDQRHQSKYGLPENTMALAHSPKHPTLISMFSHLAVRVIVDLDRSLPQNPANSMRICKISRLRLNIKHTICK